MKTLLVVPLVGLAISFALPTFAQQTNTPDPQLRQALDDLFKRETEAYNNNDAAVVAATFTEDAIFVTTLGPFYGREAIEKYYADWIQKGHFSNFAIKYDPNSIRALGTAGNEMWADGEWSLTIQAQNGPVQVHGYWGAVKAREGDTLKTRFDVSTPRPATTSTAMSSTTTTPSAQTKKEINFSGTHYWSGTPKVFQVDPDRAIVQLEIFGVRINDSGDGPFHGASVHIVTVVYRSKGYNGDRAYETWTDKDGDKVIWELMDTPPGASSSPARLIAGTGKYTDWQGTMEFTLQYPKSFPEGTMRGIYREVVRIVAPQ